MFKVCPIELDMLYKYLIKTPDLWVDEKDMELENCSVEDVASRIARDWKLVPFGRIKKFDVLYDKKDELMKLILTEIFYLGRDIESLKLMSEYRYVYRHKSKIDIDN
jgi:hypothetical protein